ncbi:hypothetical protein [Flavobacterium sp. MDT1-60]|uniref:hypothetical protein n=1 Tax=Flavobacterium sp. MDT1-60 TaxID=1979344 RepID=UPI00177D7D8B|nr:hypothetical protein [Flavobacterium sp. MDT1-60]QOG02462.1 hypothetical protein IHE43_22255 [Flavobacterium sp. MDT1-60]
MNRTLRNSFLIIIFTLFFSNLAKAQPRKGEFINASIGLGLSAPDDNADIDGTGFYAQGEYVFGLTKWFGLRPYAGFIVTSCDKNENQNQPEYKVTSKAFLFGGKARICAPILWIAPYIESGIGASIGSFETYTPFTNIKKSGILMHVPFTLGLALGPKHNVDIAFTYYFHSAADQYCGAAAFGLTFPLNQ